MRCQDLVSICVEDDVTLNMCPLVETFTMMTLCVLFAFDYSKVVLSLSIVILV